MAQIFVAFSEKLNFNENHQELPGLKSYQISIIGVSKNSLFVMSMVDVRLKLNQSLVNNIKN
jgi:hypothetical protein